MSNQKTPDLEAMAQKDSDLEVIRRRLTRWSSDYAAACREQLEARRPDHTFPVSTAVATEIERVANRLMCSDGPESLEAARERFGEQLQGRDYVMIEVSTTSTSNRSEGLGEQVEPLYQRTVVGARGAAESAVVEIARVCDALDPGGRDPAAWREPESDSASEAATDGPESTGEAESASEADDVSDLLHEHGAAALDLFRHANRISHYGERDAVVLRVSTFAGQYAPDEGPDDVLAVFALSSRPGAIEYAVRKVFELGRELDPEARSMSDLRSSTVVMEHAAELARESAAEHAVQEASGAVASAEPMKVEPGATAAADDGDDIEAIATLLRGYKPGLAKALRKSLSETLEVAEIVSPRSSGA